MHDGLGAAALLIVLIFASALPLRVPIGWGFLWLGIAGGGAVALVLRRWGQVSSYTVQVAGGLVGVTVMLGLGVVMAHFRFLRYFLAMVVAGGIAVAWLLHWSRSREASNRSFIPAMPEATASHVTMQIE